MVGAGGAPAASRRATSVGYGVLAVGAHRARAAGCPAELVVVRAAERPSAVMRGVAVRPGAVDPAMMTPPWSATLIERDVAVRGIRQPPGESSPVTAARASGSPSWRTQPGVDPRIVVMKRPTTGPRQCLSSFHRPAPALRCGLRGP